MEELETIQEADQLLRDYFERAWTDLPYDLSMDLSALLQSMSAVDRLARSVELLYANRIHLDEQGRIEMAMITRFVSERGWHGLAENQRGLKISAALLRGSEDPSDPVPSPRYVVRQPA